jgi:hypothetical protein
LDAADTPKARAPKVPANEIRVRKASGKRHRAGFSRKKSLAPAIQIGRYSEAARAYEFSGEMRVLRKALLAAMSGDGVDVLLIPGTPEAEEALERAREFRKLILRPGPTTRARARASLAKLLAAKAAARRREASQKAAIGEEAYRPDARARAILRGKIYAEEDLKAAGGAFDIDQVRNLLHGVSRQAVDKRVNERTLLAVPGPRGHRRFPTLQFDADGSPVAGLKEVQKALDFSSPWAVLNFLVNENDQLGGRLPIEVLRQGAVEQVVAAARSVGVQGA